MAPKNKGGSKVKATECKQSIYSFHPLYSISKLRNKEHLYRHPKFLHTKPTHPPSLHLTLLACYLTNARKAKDQTSSSTPPQPPPRTPNERSWQLYYATNPYQKEFEELGPHGMSPAARLAHAYSSYVKPGAADVLSKKAQKDLWKQASELNLPLRNLPRPEPFRFGRDKNGRDLGDYPIEEFDAYRAKRSRLSSLESASDRFRTHREKQEVGVVDWETGGKVEYTVTEEDTQAERLRRKEMADLRKDLFGQKTASYALDPEWDDVTPIPQVEPEGALAAIAYPEDFAECMFLYPPSRASFLP